MPYINDEFKNRLRQECDIYSVINRDVPLVRAGSNFKARCPFHSEKTPSFIVNPSTNTYHCFGCGEHGDVIKFVMKMRNLDFVSAIEYLCDLQGIEPEYDTSRSFSSRSGNTDYEERKKILELLKDTANYYYRNLRSNREACSYLTDRGLKEETIKKFGLGYSIDSFTGAYDYLTKTRGYSSSLLEKAGIVKKGEKGTYYDYFRNRVMFPIQDLNNRVIAFGGRIFTDVKNAPKYLNSPETDVFKKKSNLYNLNNAKKLLKEEPLILVEGYMDVISLVNYGIENASATLGTAFNIDHARLINRFTQNIIIMYDSDSAGEKATVKASEIFVSAGLFPKVVRLPEGEDPDSYVQKFGKEEFYRTLSKATDSVDFRISLIERETNMMDSWQKAEYVKKACRIISTVKDNVRREFYIKDLSERSRVEINTIQREIDTGSYVNTSDVSFNRQERDEKPSVKVPRNIRRSEFIILRYIFENLNNPENLEDLDFEPDLLVEDDYLEIYAIMADSINSQKKLDIPAVFDYNDNLGTTLSQIVASEAHITVDDVRHAVKTLRLHDVDERLSKVKRAINDIEDSENAPEDDSMLAALMTEFYRLQAQRNKINNGG